MPTTQANERVVFLAHFERGFTLPVSDFFWDFLDYFELQPHHLPANAVMTLSALAAFYEGYTGIEPFIQGWSKYFQLRKQSAQEPRDKNAPPKTAKEKKEWPMTQCGAATMMSQKGSDFPKIELLEFCKKWQKTFFYVKNTMAEDLINLPEYIDVPPTEMKNWTYNPRSLVGTIIDLPQVMGELTNSGLTLEDIIACFISRRVSPLQWRMHKICQMNEVMDPT
jgi:hypothetical protein